jgi:hypothetical protein
MLRYLLYNQPPGRLSVCLAIVCVHGGCSGWIPKKTHHAGNQHCPLVLSDVLLYVNSP